MSDVTDQTSDFWTPGTGTEGVSLDVIPESLTVKREPSRLYLTYPFAFDRSHLSDLARSISQASRHAWGATDDDDLWIWDQPNLSGVKAQLLPHLADQLGTSDPRRTSGAMQPNRNSGDDGASTPMLLWHLSASALSDLNRGLPFVEPESLTASHDHSVPHLELRMPGKKVLGVEIVNVRLALFSAGAGSVTLEIRPESRKLRDWLDCSYFVAKHRRAYFRISPFDSPNGTVEPRIEVIDLLSVLLNSLDLASLSSRPDRWWDEIYVSQQLFPFPTLFIDQALTEEQLGSINTRIRYGLSGRQRIELGHLQLSDAAGSSYPYSRFSAFGFSIDAASFVAASAPDDEFWSRTLPDHLGDRYLLALVIVLAQRTTLIKISKEVARTWGDDPSNESRRLLLASILADLMEFTARLQFTQIFQTEHYHACYNHLRRAFHLDELYAEVKDEITQMSAIMEHESAQRTGDLSLLQTTILGALLAGLSVRASLPYAFHVPGLVGWTIVFAVASFVLAVPLLVMHQRRAYRKVDRVAGALCGAAVLWLLVALLLWKSTHQGSPGFSALAIIPGAVLGLLVVDRLDSTRRH